MQGKLLSIAVVALAAAACSDSAVVEPRNPDVGAVRSALAVDRQFKVVTVRTDHIPPEWAYVPIVDNFQTAVARVEAGGTILVFAGTYRPAGVVIDKPVTIRAAGREMPVVEGVDGFTSFTIRDIASGLVRIEGLRFRNAGHDSFSGIFVTGQVDRVEIENSEFYPATQPSPPGFTFGFYGGISPHRVHAGAVIIRNNKFVGGDIGVHTHEAVGIVVLDNIFENQDNAAIHAANASSVHAEANTINGCGAYCIGAPAARAITLLRNTINVAFSRPVTNAIQVDGGTNRIEGNVITGAGGSRDATSAETWPIQSNAIAVSGSATVSANRVSGAFNGLGFGMATVTGSDNVVSDVGSPLNIFSATVTLHRNDFTAYARPIQFIHEPGSSSLTCNWWGSADGPAGGPDAFTGIVSPWATAPIANGGSGVCQ